MVKAVSWIYSSFFISSYTLGHHKSMTRSVCGCGKVIYYIRQLNVFYCVYLHGNVSIFSAQVLSFFNNASPAFCSSTEGVVNCEPKCVCRCTGTYVCVIQALPHIWPTDSALSISLSFYLLGHIPSDQTLSTPCCC